MSCVLVILANEQWATNWWMSCVICAIVATAIALRKVECVVNQRQDSDHQMRACIVIDIMCLVANFSAMFTCSRIQCKCGEYAIQVDFRAFQSDCDVGHFVHKEIS